MVENKKKFLAEEDFFDEEEEDAQKDKFLTFRVGDDDYGIEIRHVVEIVSMQAITAVPDMPDYIKGVINLRGNIIPVMDIRRRFHMAERPYDERTCVIVVNIQELAVGLVVDSVDEVLTIPETQISPPPKIAQGYMHRYIKGMGKVGEKVKILLDMTTLLSEKECEAIRQES